MFENYGSASGCVDYLGKNKQVFKGLPKKVVNGAHG